LALLTKSEKKNVDANGMRFKVRGGGKGAKNALMMIESTLRERRGAKK
jgi:hypothetical protein